MSGQTRPARAEEIARLWPVVRAAHLMPSIEALAEISEGGPWRVRVSDVGDAMVLSAWRDHLDVLAIRGLWAPEERIADLVHDAYAVARAQGFGRVLSPLLDERRAAPYRQAGMEDIERIVAYGAATGSLTRPTPGSDQGAGEIRIRAAAVDDVVALESLDAQCFDEFWRHGPTELTAAIRSDHVAVAVGDSGRVAGYAMSGLSGSTVAVARLAVAPRNRRQGVAIRLLADADDWGKRSGAYGLSLCTQEENEVARALYRRAGFVESTDRLCLLLGRA